MGLFLQQEISPQLVKLDASLRVRRERFEQADPLLAALKREVREAAAARDAATEDETPAALAALDRAIWALIDHIAQTRHRRQS